MGAGGSREPVRRRVRIVEFPVAISVPDAHPDAPSRERVARFNHGRVNQQDRHGLLAEPDQHPGRRKRHVDEQ